MHVISMDVIKHAFTSTVSFRGKVIKNELKLMRVI